jgi:sugar transferase EpsL
MTAKRLLDLLIVLLAIPVAIPILILTALLVRWRLGSPVLFRQLRPGKHGRPFQLVKFRSMLPETDAAGLALSDEDRLPAFGRFLRSTSLDELPEIWNVLKGEMSLVGPRPLLPEYLALYSPEQARRHEVPPGLTGWAQINGRNGLSWEDKFRLDVWYVDNRSLWLDLRILMLTIVRVLKRDGISAAGKSTMPPFRGTSRLPAETEGTAE